MTNEQYNTRQELRANLIHGEHGADKCAEYLDKVRKLTGKVSRSDIKFVATVCL